MFDLDQQIDCWKSAFAKKAACSSDELLELESHLREDIAALVAEGRSEQEAFCESVSRLGDPTEICGEFAKNENRFLWDGVALRGNRVMVNLAGLAAGLLGLAVGMKRGDGLLGAHLGSIIFAYVVPFLLAVVGTYAIFRAAMVKSGQTQFQNRFAGQCRFLFGVIALVSATGVILGGLWAERHWGRFWGWDPKEIGGLSVVVCALVLYVLVTRRKPSSVHLGQASLVMSLVTFVAWFGPAVYMESVGPSVLAVLIVCLIVQLSILSISLFLSKRTLAES
jgi:Cytochrome C assembly protein